ncbi:MAG: cell division protein FtsA [Anaerolineales bacterium]
MAGDRIIAAIDIGTTKICALVGRVQQGRPIQILGMGIVPADGLSKGVITDIEQATESIREAIRKAERPSGYTIRSAYVSVGGAHIGSQNCDGVAAIGRGDRPIVRDDLDRALENARAIPLPHNRQILHSIPRTYTIDEQANIKNPLGMIGYRLEVEAHVITGSRTAIQNIVRCVEQCDVEPIEIVLQPLASCEAVLTDDERRQGVALVDIGGGTTDLAIVFGGGFWETKVFPVGGNHISNDIGWALHVPFMAAEEAKVRYGHAVAAEVPSTDEIEMPVFGGEGHQRFSRQQMCALIEDRVTEMFAMVHKHIHDVGVADYLAAGIVLTGGCADLSGIRTVAERVFDMPVRLGSPQSTAGRFESLTDPKFATAVGLLEWGRKKMQAEPSVTQDDGNADSGFWWWLRSALNRLAP